MASEQESHSHVNTAAQPVGQFAVSAVIATVSHPMTVAKVLIQIGYEPMAPVSSTTIFGNPALVYPNMFKYMGHLRKTDGFLGLYRGLGARLCSGLVAAVVSNHASQHLGEKMSIKDDEPDKEEDVVDGLRRVCRESIHESVSRGLGTIASHPFQVICVRAIAEYVGKETHYSSVFSSIREIYQEEGVMGFFAGLMPRLIGEAITIWTVNYLVHLVNRYLIPENDNAKKMLKSYTNMICTMAVTQFTYPFTVVSSCMTVNKTRLAAGNPPYMPPYDSWRDCFSELSARGVIKRGSGMFFRYYKGPTILRHDGTMIPAPASF